MSETPTIPLPHPTALSRPHRDGRREGVLRAEFLIDGRFVDDVMMAKPL